MISDIISVKDTTMKTVVTTQAAILKKLPWPEESVSVWAYNGYFSVLSRATLTLHLDFLHHCLKVCGDMSWEVAEKELQYYDRKIALIRTNAPSRIHAMCRIYVLFRDSHDVGWRLAKLEAEKVKDLYQKILELTQNGSGTGGESSMIRICQKCGTCLHGNQPCPWSELSNTKAKRAAKNALKAMANQGGGEEEG